MKSSKDRSKNDHYSRKTEYGYFNRTTITRGSKRRTKTTKIKPNQEKVVLGHLGGLQFYCFPFNYPDKVFVGIYPLSVPLNIEDSRQLLGIFNKIRWFLDGHWQKEPKNSKGAKSRRQRIVRAYNLGVSKLKKLK